MNINARHVSELSGRELNAAVALAEGWRADVEPLEHWLSREGEYCSDWRAAGKIIERERISVVGEWDHKWWRAGLNAEMGSCERLDHSMYGPTPLIAAMRAYVASRMAKT